MTAGGADREPGATGFRHYGRSGAEIVDEYVLSLTLASTTFADNRAIAGNEPIAIRGGNGSVGRGGAIYHVMTGTMVVAGSTFTNNQASGGNGGEGSPGAEAGRGAIDVTVPWTPSPSPVVPSATTRRRAERAAPADWVSWPWVARLLW